MSPFLIVSLLGQLVLIGAIIYGVYLWRRRSDRFGPDLGIGTPRRVYFYSISFLALMLVASGAWMVLYSLLDDLLGLGSLLGDSVVRGSTTRLASGLALIIVGVPLWFFHWRFVQRSVGAYAAENRSILRKLYLYVAQGVALGFLAYHVYRAVEWVLQAGDFSALVWAAIVVWAPLWAYHWRIAAQESPEPTQETRGVRRLYLYLASALGMSMLAAGAGWVLYLLFRDAYSAAFSRVVLLGDGGLAWDALRSSLSVAIVGAVIWWTHWLRFAYPDRGSLLRWVYLFVAAVGGVCVALMGLGTFIHSVVAWIVGASNEAAVEHFASLHESIATVVAGTVLWTYHRRRMLDETDTESAREVSRIYDLLVAAIGMIGLAAASVIVVDTLLRLVSDSAPVIVSSDLNWRFRLAKTLTMLGVGGPVWWMHWRRIQSAAVSDPRAERTAMPRRVYVLGVLCLGMLALVGSLSTTLFIFFRDLLATDLSAETVQDLATSLATAVTALIIVTYHWVNYREDRQYEPEVPPEPAQVIRKRVTLLTATGGSELVDQVESALGYPISAVHWPDSDAFVPDLTSAQIASLPGAVAAAPGAAVLLVPSTRSGLRIVSHD